MTLSVIPQEGERPALVLRRLNYGKPILRIRDSFRPSRAHRALKLAAQLEQAGIPTARVYAATCVRTFRWPTRAYLLMEKIENAQSMSQYLREEHFIPRRLIDSFAELLALLHECGFSHRDLKLTNVLLTPDLKLSLIDMDGVRHYGKLPLRRALRDLARMVQDVMPRWPELKRPAWMFLLRYCQLRHLPEPRSLGYEILELAGQKAKQPSTIRKP